MLAIMPGMIAGSVLTKPAIQHHNIGAQVSLAYRGYKSGWFSDWGKFVEYVLPYSPIPIGVGAGLAKWVREYIQASREVDSWRLAMRYLKRGMFPLRISPWGAIITAA
jgi:hypothetical protein